VKIRDINNRFKISIGLTEDFDLEVFFPVQQSLPTISVPVFTCMFTLVYIGILKMRVKNLQHALEFKITCSTFYQVFTEN